jgi:hypothetical protein
MEGNGPIQGSPRNLSKIVWLMIQWQRTQSALD